MYLEPYYFDPCISAIWWPLLPHQFPELLHVYLDIEFSRGGYLRRLHLAVSIPADGETAFVPDYDSDPSGRTIMVPILLTEAMRQDGRELAALWRSVQEKDPITGRMKYLSSARPADPAGWFQRWAPALALDDLDRRGIPWRLLETL